MNVKCVWRNSVQKSANIIRSHFIYELKVIDDE